MMWYKQNPGRLLKEQAIMRASFPQARLVRLSDGNLAWIVRLKTNTGRIYMVEILYPDRFPATYPLAYVMDPQLRKSPHQYSDGHLCLFRTSDRPERTYIPEKTTAATITAWTAAWLASYEIYQQTGRWPERRVM